MDLRELEDMVAEDPRAADPYLVYADHLQERGDPRGELITLDLLRMEDPHDPERVRAIASHLERHMETLLGPIADLRLCLRNVTWRLGFIKRVTLDHPAESRPADVGQFVDLLLSAPAGRFIEDLTITPLLGGNYTPVIEAIGREPRRSLTSLRLGPLNGPVRLDLHALYTQVPNLRSLAICSSEAELGAIDLPKLVELDLWLNVLSPEAARAISSARWDHLESISIATDTRPLHLRRLFAAHLPSLTSVKITSDYTLDGVVEWLSAVPFAEQLEHLSLTYLDTHTMMDLGAAHARFPMLQTLRVDALIPNNEHLRPFFDRGVDVVVERPLVDVDPWTAVTEVEDGYDRTTYVGDHWDMGQFVGVDDETGVALYEADVGQGLWAEDTI